MDPASRRQRACRISARLPIMRQDDGQSLERSHAKFGPASRHHHLAGRPFRSPGLGRAPGLPTPGPDRCPAAPAPAGAACPAGRAERTDRRAGGGAGGTPTGLTAKPDSPPARSIEASGAPEESRAPGPARPANARHGPRDAPPQACAPDRVAPCSRPPGSPCDARWPPDRPAPGVAAGDPSPCAVSRPAGAGRALARRPHRARARIAASAASGWGSPRLHLGADHQPDVRPGDGRHARPGDHPPG